MLHTNRKGIHNVQPTKRNNLHDRYTDPSCADWRFGDPMRMRAYLVQIELEVDFQTYGPEPSVGLDGGFDIEAIYSPDDPNREDVTDMLSEKALESIYDQVFIHIKRMKDDY